MKERIINIIKLIGALIMFFYLSTLLVTVIKYLGFTINNYQDLVVLSMTAEIIMASVIFISCSIRMLIMTGKLMSQMFLYV